MYDLGRVHFLLSEAEQLERESGNTVEALTAGCAEAIAAEVLALPAPSDASRKFSWQVEEDRRALARAIAESNVSGYGLLELTLRAAENRWLYDALAHGYPAVDNSTFQARWDGVANEVHSPADELQYVRMTETWDATFEAKIHPIIREPTYSHDGYAAYLAPLFATKAFAARHAAYAAGTCPDFRELQFQG